MNTQTRLAFSTSTLGAGAAMLMATLIVLAPFAPMKALADDSTASSTPSTASSTPVVVVASSTPDSTSTSASTSPEMDMVASSTPLTNPTLNFAFSIPVSDPTGDNPIPVTATFSEPVTGFQLSSLNIALGHAANFVAVSPTVYTFDVDVTAPNGTVSIDSNDGNVRDANGDIAIAAPQLHVRFDSTLPNNTGSASSTGSTGGSTGGNGGGSTGGTGGMSTSTPPYVVFTGGPADGSTISTSTATFTFETDGVSTITCSFGSVMVPYGCGSPQTFNNLVDGVYPFSVFAQYGTTTASTTSTFTVDLEAASSSTATSTDDSGTATSTDTTATSTDSTGSTSGNGGGVSGQSSGGFFGGGTSGGSIPGYGSGGSTNGSTGGSTSGGTSTTTTGSYGNETTGTTGTGTAGAGYGYGAKTVTTSNTSEDAASTTASTTGLTLGGGDAASTSQEAAAGLSGATKTVLWTSLILVILALIGGAYWFSRRNA
jgi:hypothetical protein